MPDMGATVVRGHLQSASINWMTQGLVADKVFPSITMPTNKSKITVFNRGDAFRDEVDVRARGSVTEWMDWKTSEVSLDSKQYAAKHKITKEDLQDAGIKGIATPPLDLRQNALIRNAAKLDLKKERVTETIVTDGTWADGAAGGTDTDAKWVASSGNTFIVDADTAVQALNNGGVSTQNIRLLIDYKTGMAVKRISDVTAALAYTGRGPTTEKGFMVSEKAIADLLGIEQFIIAKAVFSSALEKAAGDDFTTTPVWDGDNAKGFGFYYYFPPGGKLVLNDMAAGLLAFHKMENGARRASYEWYSKDAHSWFYESQEDYGAIQVAAQAGYLWVDTHTT